MFFFIISCLAFKWKLQPTCNYNSIPPHAFFVAFILWKSSFQIYIKRSWIQSLGGGLGASFTKTWPLSSGLKISGRALRKASYLHVSGPERRHRPWRPPSDFLQLPELEEAKETRQTVMPLKGSSSYSISIYCAVPMCQFCATCWWTGHFLPSELLL